MKNKIAVLSLALASSVFALNEYLPIAPKAVEIDVGVSHNAPEVGDAYQTIPLAVKYGLMEGLTLELASDFSLQDPGGGLGQPQLAAKYSISAVEGLAVFANVVLPFATGDRADGYKGLGIAPGVVYGKNYGKISAVALAGYQINMKDSDDFEADDVLKVFLKPGYIVDEKLVGYVGVDYTAQGDLNQTKLLPGLTYTVSPSIALEANVPFVVAESNTGKGWGINAFLYYTIPGM